MQYFGTGPKKEKVSRYKKVKLNPMSILACVYLCLLNRKN